MVRSFQNLFQLHACWNNSLIIIMSRLFAKKNAKIIKSYQWLFRLRYVFKKKNDIIWEFFPTWGGGLPKSQNFCKFEKQCLFGSKTVFLGQEVHYYMVYIAYFTELNSKIWDYAQKRRICRENCNYALDERFHGHVCPRRKPAKSCHPAHANDVDADTDTLLSEEEEKRRKEEGEKIWKMWRGAAGRRRFRWWRRRWCKPSIL